tara:strand:+ start:7020 stop:8690 length:1671 start_codon:yes stop_codon:yes gene_type:complete
MKNSVTLFSDINLDYLKKILVSSSHCVIDEVHTSKVNQFYQSFLDDNNLIKIKSEYLFIWPSPETISPTYQKIKNSDENIHLNLENEIYEYVSRIKVLATKYEYVFVPLMHDFFKPMTFGISDMQFDTGVGYCIYKMNSLLIESLKNENNIYLLDSDKWFRNSNKWDDQKLWLRAKIPFSIDFMKIIANEIYASILTIRGKQKKIIVLDLDNTLWGGIVGDDGWENIKIGGHDYIGEAFLEFQKNLKVLQNRGILLAIASKNEATIVKKAFENNNYMLLKYNDFIAKKINWNDKTENIIEISKNVNLGLDSFVFIDDSPYERERVKNELPEVYVPDFPEDPSLLSNWLKNLNCFNSIKLTKEDLNRNKAMNVEMKKIELKNTSSNFEEWLDSLKIEINIQPISSVDFDRAIQLINKTNQMNLKTNRYSPKKFREIVDNPDILSLSVKIKDRLSTEELMGIIILEKANKIIKLNDFILSCRAFGKNIESTMLGVVYIISKKLDLSIKKIDIKKTEKNLVCQKFFESIDHKNIKFSYETNDNNLVTFSDLRTKVHLLF